MCFLWSIFSISTSPTSSYDCQTPKCIFIRPLCQHRAKKRTVVTMEEDEEQTEEMSKRECHGRTAGTRPRRETCSPLRHAEQSHSEVVHKQQRQGWAPCFFSRPDKEMYNYVGQEIVIQEGFDSYAGTIWPGVSLSAFFLNVRLSPQMSCVLLPGFGSQSVPGLASEPAESHGQSRTGDRCRDRPAVRCGLAPR